jgi:hypothetical protein
MGSMEQEQPPMDKPVARQVFFGSSFAGTTLFSKVRRRIIQVTDAEGTPVNQLVGEYQEEVVGATDDDLMQAGELLERIDRGLTEEEQRTDRLLRQYGLI